MGSRYGSYVRLSMDGGEGDLTVERRFKEGDFQEIVIDCSRIFLGGKVDTFAASGNTVLDDYAKGCMRGFNLESVTMPIFHPLNNISFEMENLDGCCPNCNADGRGCGECFPACHPTMSCISTWRGSVCACEWPYHPNPSNPLVCILDPCKPDRCLNGGSCVALEKEYECRESKSRRALIG